MSPLRHTACTQTASKASLSLMPSSPQALADFLQGIEKRAYQRVHFAVKDSDAALDIVQDAMLKLAEHYAKRSPAEWAPLFHRIVTNLTMDWFRRRTARRAWMVNLSELVSSDEGHEDDDSAQALLDWLSREHPSVPSSIERASTLRAIQEELAQLPARQREAFLLRYWEEFDVNETALIMNCSEGSVKTHCMRAVARLAKTLSARGLAP